MANAMKYPNTTVGAGAAEGRAEPGEVRPLQGRGRGTVMSGPADARPFFYFGRHSRPYEIKHAPHSQRVEAAPQEREAAEAEPPRRQEDEGQAEGRRRRPHRGRRREDRRRRSRSTQATLDRAADKGYIHKNKAARLKSRLAKKIKAAAQAK